jgi:phosphoglycerate dehydrogenase-like enzyme
MPTVVSTVDQGRFLKYQVFFPEDWKVIYIDAPYTDDQLINSCRNSDYLFVNSTHPVSKRVIEACPHLKMIHVEGVGYDKVDVVTAREMKIPVCNNQAVNNGAVAEHTIGLMLASLRRIAYVDSQVKSEGFITSQKEYRAKGEHELQGKRIGIVGFGAIGKEVAIRLSKWGCQISYYDAFRPSTEVEQKLGVNYLELDELLRTCDIITLHVPVMRETVNMISTAQFEMMKPTVVLVNTARGEIIDSCALATALEAGKIDSAAIDTIAPEPPPDDHPLLHLSPEAKKRLTITPHVGGTTDEAFVRMLKNAIANMQRVERGERPVNVVNNLI